MAKVVNCIITEKEALTETIYKLFISSKDIAESCTPGQFLHIKCGEERVLRRPISICDIISDEVCFVVEIRGDGTRWLCNKNVGDSLDVMGPLGNGFACSDKNTIFVGGGVGVPPLLYAAKSTSGKTSAILGFRNKSNIILVDKFERICDSVCVTTDDGSYGIKGSVIEPLKALLNNKDVHYEKVMTCGPRPMMEAVSKLCFEYNIECLVSLEERMGCGIGACMVCACKTLIDGTEKMSHVCVDGPVFDAKDVVW